MVKRPDSIEDFQRKRREKDLQRREESEYTRGQQDDRNTHIKRGQEAWLRHKEDATWNDWMAIGQALSIGREDAMAAAGTNAPVGSRYNVEFGNWLVRHKFDDIDKGDRSRLFDIMANLPAIEEWRHGLPQNQRLKFNHPSTVLRRWKAATVVKVPKEPKPTLKDSVIRLEEDNAQLTRENADLTAQLQEAEAAKGIRELQRAPTEGTPAMFAKGIAAMIVARFEDDAYVALDEIRREVAALKPPPKRKGARDKLR
jgi:hypothetical protein